MRVFNGVRLGGVLTGNPLAAQVSSIPLLACLSNPVLSGSCGALNIGTHNNSRPGVESDLGGNFIVGVDGRFYHLREGTGIEVDYSGSVEFAGDGMRSGGTQGHGLGQGYGNVNWG